MYAYFEFFNFFKKLMSQLIYSLYYFLPYSKVPQLSLYTHILLVFFHYILDTVFLNKNLCKPR